MLWRKFLGSEFGLKFQEEVPLFLKAPEFPYNTMYDRSKEDSIPKNSPVRSAVSIEHKLVTDRQTDTHTAIATRASIKRRAGENG